LPGVEPATPVLRCNSFERHILPAKYEGWMLQVDDGIDDTEPMTFGGCKVDKMSVEAKQGGTVVLRMRCGTSDLDAARSGFLGMHVGQPIWLTLTAPKVQEKPIDASSSASDLPPDAGDMFADAHGDAEPASDGAGKVELNPEAAWPFPGQGGPTPVIERSQPGTRTARGRDKTKQALAAGAKA
jgi:hypothetical protein